MEDILSELISFISGLAVAFITFYLHKKNKEKELRAESDKKRFFELEKRLGGKKINDLRDPDFYEGVSYELIKSIREVSYDLERDDNYLNFYNEKINSYREDIKKSFNTLQAKVGAMTVPSESHELVTTRCDYRKYHITEVETVKKRNEQESEVLREISIKAYNNYKKLENSVKSNLSI